MPSRRFPWGAAFVVVLAGTLTLPQRGRANDDPAPPQEKAPAIQLPTDPKMKRKLEAARDYVREQSWPEACRLVQALLDAGEDTFVPVPARGAGGKEETATASVRAEANRLLTDLPPAGREHYELLYGPMATVLLKEGRAKNDADRFAQVARRFLWTRAGAEALGLVASHHVAAGNHALAAGAFAGLIGRLEPKEWTTEMLYSAARVFRRAADREHAAWAWKEFQGRAQQGKVRVGDRTRTIAEWESDLDNLPLAPADGGKDWPVYRRDPGRSGEGAGDKPFLEKDWGAATVHQTVTKNLLAQAVQTAEKRNQPVLPGFFPVAVDGKVFYRDYWGLHACDLATGRVVWESDSRYSVDRLFDPQEGGNRSPLANTWANGFVQMGRPGMLFENSVIGTLSADATRVYVVDDLYVPPSTGMVMNGGMVMVNQQYGNGQYGALRDAVFANKLCAYNLRSGKLFWDIAAAPEKADEESYFLGPPLPLHGKLYVLTERNQDLRLLCLDPERGTVQWSQLLATTQGRLSQEVTRRTWAAHLSYGEGVLVCPTNAGMLLGVDLLSHAVLWAHSYREKEQTPANVNAGGPLVWPGARIVRPGMIINGNPGANGVNTPEWKVTAPVVRDGRVVFTAPDGTSVRCLNLRDGSLVWKAPRTDDDLYLAGVARGKVLVVGLKDCRALNFTDGSKVWQVATGQPSGQGVFSGSEYYLPLKESRQREPEVCVLNVDQGKIVVHTRSRKHELPGNLLFYGDKIVSQTVEEVAAFPQLQVRRADVTRRIGRNPKDPVGLAERGELYLDDGRSAEAVADLQACLKNDPEPQLRARVRARLYDALTDYLRDHFQDAEKHLDDYREVCRVDAAPNAGPEEAMQAATETARRRATYLALLGRGREQQGKVAEALQAYADFAATAAGNELVSVPDEPAVKAPADVWAHGRIRALLARATPEQRQVLTDVVAKQWQAVRQAGDTAGLRTFVRLFGSAGTSGREARALLAERLTNERHFAEAERELLLLRQQTDDRTAAARATEALARLAVQQGLFEDGLFWYRTLGRDFADVVVRDGKTGADFLKDLSTDKRFLPYLHDPPRHDGGLRMRLNTENGQFAPARVLLQVEPEGEVLPFFRRHRITLDQNTHFLELVDRETNEVRWQTRLTATQFVTRTPQGQVLVPAMTHYSYRTAGRVLVLPLGNLVFGVDPIKQQVLWEKSLLDAAGLPAASQQSQLVQDPKEGTVAVLYADGWQQPIGQLGPVHAEGVCLLTQTGLHVLDPLSGRLLWARPDVGPRGRLFGDEEHLYFVAPATDGDPAVTRALRMSDGVALRAVPDFTAVYQNRQHLDGSHILASESRPGKVLVRLYDVPSGKDLWKKDCPAGSLVVSCEEPHEGAVLEPDGWLTVIDLRSGRESLRARVDPKDVERLQGASLLRDDTQYYLAINGPGQVGAIAGSFPAFQGGTGPRSVPVNGRIYAIDPATGKVNWATLEATQQILVVDSFRELPFLLLVSRSNRMINGRFGVAVNGNTGVTVVSKHNGKLLSDEKDLPNAQQQFHTFNVNLREGKIELISFNLKVTLTLEKAPKRAP
jgi:outer membrane protein assembly factor BamB/tetratricopeptide (TPR) repeat protein